MKTYLTQVTSVIILSFLVACVYEKTAFRTVGTLTTTVDAAMKAYGDEVKLGHISADTQNTVKSAYDKYYAAIQVAQSVTLSYKAGDATQSAVKQALDAATAAATPLIAMVKTFIPKEKAAALNL